MEQTKNAALKCFKPSNVLHSLIGIGGAWFVHPLASWNLHVVMQHVKAACMPTDTFSVDHKCPQMPPQHAKYRHLSEGTLV